MLFTVTWGQYWLYVGLFSLVYYLFIAFAYYGRELSSIFGPKPPKLFSFNEEASPISNVIGPIHDAPKPVHDILPEREPEEEIDEPIQSEHPPFENEADISNSFEEMEILAQRLRHMMEAASNKASKADLMENIAKELKTFLTFSDVRNYGPKLNEYICINAREYCDIELSSADINAIWQSANPKSSAI